MTATVTAEFRDEFEAERTRWLRRRVLWYFGVSMAFGALSVLAGGATLFVVDGIETRDFNTVAHYVSAAVLTVNIIAFLVVLRRRLTRAALLSLVYWCIVGGASLSLLALEIAFSRLAAPEITAAGAPGSEMVATIGLYTIFVSHFIASLFIPWTPRECLRPFIPMYLVFVAATLVSAPMAWWRLLLFAAGGAAAALPGLSICWWRQSRFRDKFHYQKLRGRYTEIRRELVDARRIHEALFPAPVTAGRVRMDYRYSPVGHLGGDFLFAFRFPGLPGEEGAEPLSIILLDVTGHGLAAALTVNRLHGELERLFAEEPDIAPGDALYALNRYIHLTLATHSVYATALCLRADPRADTLLWASAGHPPAFVRTVDGRLEQLDSTALVLGACAPADFDAGERRLRFGPGDTLIAYTDGATDARDAGGRMLRTEGLRRIVSSARPDLDGAGGWASAVLRAVEERRAGAALDDILVVEMFRPLRV